MTNGDAVMGLVEEKQRDREEEAQEVGHAIEDNLHEVVDLRGDAQQMRAPHQLQIDGAWAHLDNTEAEVVREARPGLEFHSVQVIDESNAFLIAGLGVAAVCAKLRRERDLDRTSKVPQPVPVKGVDLGVTTEAEAEAELEGEP